VDGRREIKKKTYFAKYAKDARRPSGYEASGPGWARRLGPTGRPRPVGVVAGPVEAEAQWEEENGRLEKKEMGRGWVAGPKVKKKDFWIKNWILNLPRLGKFVEGDLGGILTW
jgi:hypothetical protein